jgi:hypothetical protein
MCHLGAPRGLATTLVRSSAHRRRAVCARLTTCARPGRVRCCWRFWTRSTSAARNVELQVRESGGRRKQAAGLESDLMLCGSAEVDAQGAKLARNIEGWSGDVADLSCCGTTQLPMRSSAALGRATAKSTSRSARFDRRCRVGRLGLRLSRRGALRAGLCAACCFCTTACLASPTGTACTVTSTSPLSTRHVDLYAKAVGHPTARDAEDRGAPSPTCT